MNREKKFAVDQKYVNHSGLEKKYSLSEHDTPVHYENTTLGPEMVFQYVPILDKKELPPSIPSLKPIHYI